MPDNILDLSWGFDDWLREELRKRNVTEADFSRRIVDQLGGEERYTQLIIDRINVFSNSSASAHASLLGELPQMSDEEIKAFLGAQDTPARFLLAYHYYLARDAYRSLFINFRRVVARPEHFLAALFDCLELDLNTRLYVYTKPIGTCRGLIFELENGVSADRKMGILLTPLAFDSPPVFFQTLFHELAHRLHFAREGRAPGRLESELAAYLQDKCLLRAFLTDVDIAWLTPAFEADPFGLARRFRDEEPNFFTDTARQFATEAERIRPQMVDHFARGPSSLTAARINRICGNASEAARIPRFYQSVLDFLWLYSTRLCSRQRLTGDPDLWKTHATCFVLLALFSEEYERKYHPEPGNLVYGPVSILHANGTWGAGEDGSVRAYCALQQQFYREECHASG